MNFITLVHLSSKGTVVESEGLYEYTNGRINDKDILNKHIKDVLLLIKNEGITLPKNNEIEKAINEYEKRIYFKEELLNCVMYRIKERGGNRIGPRRGFLFAKEFGRNIDIPMMYAVDYSDPGLRQFMNEYIKAGGRKDLICYENYFSRPKNCQALKTVTIQKLIKTLWNDAATRYTPEETELHQRMIDVLNSQINEDTLRKEKSKQLRLERKK